MQTVPKLKPVTNGQLLKTVAKEVELPRGDVEKIMNCYLETIVETLRAGYPVVISGFGKFKPRKPRTGNCRNPVNGKAVLAPHRKSVTFRTSQGLKNTLNEKKEQ